MSDKNRPLGYQFDLDIQLETAIDTYEQDRTQFWQESHDPEVVVAKIAFSQTERIAEALLESAEALLPNDGLPDIETELGGNRTTFLEELSTYQTAILDTYRANGLSPPPAEFWRLEMAGRPPDGPLKLVWERLCIKLAWDGVSSMRKGALRILELWGFLLDIQPDTRTLPFLRRVGRCFIWGFDPECIIVCRGALDTAFRDAVSDDICKSIFPDREPEDGEFGLANRIVAAYKTQLIDKSTKKIAFSVKMRGDKAVHDDPNASKDVAGTIKDTIIVLKELERGTCP